MKKTGALIFLFVIILIIFLLFNPYRVPAGAVRIRTIDGMEMAYIPAGVFIMGSNSGESHEQPVHEVYLHDFWIDRTEITNAMFNLFYEDTGHITDGENAGASYVFINGVWTFTRGADWEHPHGPGSSIEGLDDHPVVQLSWDDANAYCAYVGGRLPTEAEWEKAARSYDERLYPWGDQTPTSEHANMSDINSDIRWANQEIDDGYEFTSPVGSYPLGASPYGILDMAGNVLEWVTDWYGENYIVISQRTFDPQGPESGEYRIVRGGSWFFTEFGLRTSYRSLVDPGSWHPNVGFRCVFDEMPH